MKHPNLKRLSKYLCLIFTLVCSIAVLPFLIGSPRVANASDLAFELYYTNDYSGSSTDYSTSDTTVSIPYVYKSLRFFYYGYEVKTFNIPNDVTINVDLNGRKLVGNAIAVEGTVKLYDYAGNGSGKFDVKNQGRLLYYGNENTSCSLSVNTKNGGSIKIYSGKVTFLVCTSGLAEDTSSIADALPEGYAFVAHKSNGAELYPYATAASTNNYTSANNNPIQYLTVQKCNHPKITDGVCVYCNAQIDGTEALETAKEELEAAKASLTEAINKKADTATLTSEIEKLNKAIEAAKTACNNYSDKANDTLKTALETSISDGDAALQTAIDNAVKKAADELAAAKTELTGLIDTNKTNIANNATAIEDAKKDYQAKIDAANGLISALQTTTGEHTTAINKLNDDLTSAKTELTAAIKTAVDGLRTELTAADGDLKKLIDANKGSIDTNAGNISKNASDISKNASKISQNADAIKTINGLLATLQSTSDTQDEDIADLKTRVAALETTAADLQAQITKLKTDLESAIETAINGLRTDLEKADSGLNDLITANTGNISKNAGEISKNATAISKNADDIAAIKTAIEDLKTVNGTQDDRLTALETKASDLESKIDTVNSTLTAAIAKLREDLTAADSALRTDIDKNTGDISDNAAKINKNAEDITAINKLIEALQATDATYGDDIKDLKKRVAALESKVSELIDTTVKKLREDLDAAKTDFEERITANANGVSTNAQAIADAKADYQKKIDDVNALISGLTTKNGEQDETIADLQSQITAAKTKLESLISTTKQELDDKITAAINKASKDLTDAKAELNGLITANANGVSKNAQDLIAAKNDYEAKIAAANTLIAGLTDKNDEQDDRLTSLEAKVADLQSQLTAAISDLNAKITAAIAKASDDLAKAKAELEAAINAKADSVTISDKIEKLNYAVENAQEISENFADEKDATLKTDLEKQIKDSKTELEGAIASLSARLGDAEKKIDGNAAEIKTLKIFIIVALSVMLIFGVCSIITLAAIKRVAAQKNGQLDNEADKK